MYSVTSGPRIVMPASIDTSGTAEFVLLLFLLCWGIKLKLRGCTYKISKDSNTQLHFQVNSGILLLATVVDISVHDL